MGVPTAAETPRGSGVGLRAYAEDEVVKGRGHRGLRTGCSRGQGTHCGTGMTGVGQGHGVAGVDALVIILIE